jgi:hypothetical protein
MQSYSTETVYSVNNLSKCPQNKIDELKPQLDASWQSANQDAIKKLNNGRFWLKLTIISATIATIITIAAIIIPIPVLVLTPLFVTPFFAVKALMTSSAPKLQCPDAYLQAEVTTPENIKTEMDQLKRKIAILESENTKLEMENGALIQRNQALTLFELVQQAQLMRLPISA